MSTKYVNSAFRISRRNCIIFILVGFLAIQNLAFQIIFRLNIPYSIDFQDVFSPMFNQIVKDEFSFLVNKGIHVILFPKLISYPNFYLNSFDVVNITYVYWIVISITLFLMYLMIKQTDKRLFWTLIPISAFLYNPLTSSGYWMVAMLAWYFPMLGIVSTIYLFNRKTIKLKIFTSGVSLAIFSTFSILIGVVSWIAGIVILLKAISEKRLENKKWISLWIISSVIIGFCYLSLTYGTTDSEIRFDVLFSFTGFSFISNFIASSFRLKFEILMLLAGTLSLSLSIFYLWMSVKKNILKEYFSWFTLLFTAFCGSVITTLGRAHLEDHLGNEPYYSPISQLFQIGLIVITGKLIIDFNQNPKTIQRKIFVSILIFIIITQMLLLVPSYYSGWERGAYYFNEKMDFVNCFTLFPNPICLERYSTYEDDLLPMINYLIENKLSIFSESLIINQENIIFQNFNNFEHFSELSSTNNLESINDDEVINMSKYELDSEIVSLNGWFQVDSNSIPESLFLIIDGKPLLENKTFQVKSDSSDNLSTKISWSIFFLSGYLEPGCHSLQFVAVTSNEKINLDDEFVICKNN